MIMDKIHEIGRIHGLESWIETPLIPLPENYTILPAPLFENLKKNSGGILSSRDLSGN